MKKIIIRIISILLITTALIAFCVALEKIVTPKRSSFGCLWGEYLAEPENSIDVMVYGSSISYCDIIPAQIYEKSGITSYVMAGPVQTMSETYRYVLETCRTQNPKYIFIEASSLFYSRVEEFDLVNIGYMPFSINKYAAMFEGVPASEWVNYLFPIYAYHGRYSELTKEDFEKAFEKKRPDIRAGYTWLIEHKEFPDIEPKEENYTDETLERDFGYLERIAEFCLERGITPVIYLSPRRNSLSEKSIRDLEMFVEEKKLLFKDFNENAEEMKLDSMTDYYDRSHLNFYGAMKFGEFFTGYLTDELKIGKSIIIDKELWNSRVDYYKSLPNA